MDMELASLKGVGPKLLEKFDKLGLDTVGQLLWYLPREYRDESKLTKLGQAKLGRITARVTFSSITSRRARRGMLVTEAIASDKSGNVKVIWFKQPYRQKQLAEAKEWYLSGELKFARGRVNIVSPTLESADGDPLNTGRIVPIYRESAGLSSRVWRKIISQALDQTHINETLPEWLVKKEKLYSLARALASIHFPASHNDLEEAKKRLSYEELFRFMIANLLGKEEIKSEQAVPINFDVDLAKQFVTKLPFKLTDAQRKTIWQIYKDIEQSVPANRLIEGDVGAGKTVVAAMAALMVIKGGGQVAFMAPTEILARQHAESLRSILENVGYGDQVGLLVGSLKPSNKKRAHDAIRQGKIGLVVGTHALIAEAVSIPALQLVIVDEQHRFGVEQRKKLQNKAKIMPHALYLTATPIPRSLALTLYGELDVSILDEKPAGRMPIMTKIVKPGGFTEVLRAIELTAQSGGQVFVVCPLISDSNNPHNLMAAENMEAYLASKLKPIRVGLVHGKQKQLVKEQAMEQFVGRDTKVLVATTVVEVGVDVANASLMVIMGADKFGLAQLHQLRGRVGRGKQQAHCILVPSEDDIVPKRLVTMTNTQDGFKLAEYDLEERGPGAIYGTFQHGVLDLKIAKLTDMKLIAAARRSALEFMSRESLTDWSDLTKSTSLLRQVTYLN